MNRWLLIPLLFAGAQLAYAQSFVADNQLRLQLLELEEKINNFGVGTESIATDQIRLQQENNLLGGLIGEIRRNMNDAVSVQDQHDQETRLVESSIIDRLATSRATIINNMSALNNLLDGVDAQNFAQGLEAYCKFGDHQLALDHLALVLDLGGRSNLDADARYWAGRINYEQSNFSSAIDHLKILLDQHPDSAHEADALYMLTEMSVLIESRRDAIRWGDLLERLYPASSANERLNINLRF